jgi:hypothetical protein
MCEVLFGICKILGRGEAEAYLWVQFQLKKKYKKLCKKKESGGAVIKTLIFMVD